MQPSQIHSETRRTWLKLLQLADNGSSFSTTTASFLNYCPKPPGKYFWLTRTLPVWDLCHGKMIMICLKMLYNTRPCLRLTNIWL